MSTQALSSLLVSWPGARSSIVHLHCCSIISRLDVLLNVICIAVGGSDARLSFGQFL